MFLRLAGSFGTASLTAWGRAAAKRAENAMMMMRSGSGLLVARDDPKGRLMRVDRCWQGGLGLRGEKIRNGDRSPDPSA
jgi:hypothetical protein